VIPGIRYRVTRASDDGTFQVGDVVSLCHDGDIMFHAKALGEITSWVRATDVPEAIVGWEIREGETGA